MSFVVTWNLCEAAECPDYRPDEYGRWPSYHCCVMHYKFMPMSKEFETRLEAERFIEGAGWRPGSFQHVEVGKVSEFKIEEKK